MHSFEQIRTKRENPGRELLGICSRLPWRQMHSRLQPQIAYRNRYLCHGGKTQAPDAAERDYPRHVTTVTVRGPQTGGRSRFETFFGGAGSVLAGGRLGHLLGGVRSERKRPALGRRRNHICSRHKPQEACWTVWLLGRGSSSYSLVDRHPQRGSALKPITLTTHARAPRAYSTGVAGFSGLIAFSILVWRDRS